MVWPILGSTTAKEPEQNCTNQHTAQFSGPGRAIGLMCVCMYVCLSVCLCMCVQTMTSEPNKLWPKYLA